MAIVKEYVRTAESVSSQVLYKKYNFNASSATLRLDMAELTERGYLIQPHTSAGRIPTEKGYHFYIQKISSPKLPINIESQLEKVFEHERKEDVLNELGRMLSIVSRNVSFLFFEESLIWQGLSFLFSQPEFYSREEVLEFAKIYDEFKDRLIELEQFLDDYEQDIKVLIGKENPLLPSKDLSFIFGEWEEGLIGILGPRRMDYRKNIALIKKAKDLLDKNF